MAEDHILVAATLQGDLHAFEALARRYQHALVTSAYYLLRRAEDAEDLAQEALLEAYRQLRQLRDRTKFRPWLFTILRRKCLRHLQQSQPEALSLDACPEIPATTCELPDEEAAELLCRLPLADREVLAARYLQELDYEEIAQMLGTSVRAARMRCLRARERLRTLMEDADETRTRRLLQRALSGVALGLSTDAFMHRVLQEIKPMEMTFAKPITMPKPTAWHLPGMPAWLPAAGWKMAAGMAVVLAVAGISSRPASPARQTAAMLSVPTTLRQGGVFSPVKSNPLRTLDQLAPPSLEGRGPGGEVGRREVATSVASAPVLLAQADRPAGATAPATASAQVPAAVENTGKPELSLQMGQGHDVRMAMSPDGKRVATESVGHCILIWDLTSGLIEQRITDFLGIDSRTLAFSSDGTRLISSRWGQPPFIWDITAERAVPVSPAIPGDGCFTQDGKRYWASKVTEKDEHNALKSREELELWDVAGGTIERRVPGVFGSLEVVSRDNTRAVTLTGSANNADDIWQGTTDTELIVWDLTTGKEVTRLHGLANPPRMDAEQFSPDGSKFAASAWGPQDDDDVYIWDTRTGALLHRLAAHTSRINELSFSEDGVRLASGAGDQQAIVWDVASGNVVRKFEHEYDVWELAFTRDGTQLLTGARQGPYSGPLRVWDVASGKVVRTLEPKLKQAECRAIAASRDGRRLAVGKVDVINLWDLAKGCVSSSIPLPANAFPSCMAFSPDGSTLLAGLNNQNGEGTGTLKVWNVATGAQKASMFAHASEINGVAFSPDGHYAVSASNDRTISLRNTDNWHEIKRLTDLPGKVDTVLFTRDGLKLAWLCTTWKTDGTNQWPAEGRLMTWDIPGGQRTTYEAGDGSYFTDLAASPDGKWLQCNRNNEYTGKTDKRPETVLWDIAQAKEYKRLTLPASVEATRTLFFTADSTALVGTSGDVEETVILLHIADGTVTKTAIPTTFRRLLLTRNGSCLITTELFGMTQLWDLPQALSQPTAQPRATCYSFDKGRWLATTPEGYFDCTPELAPAIAWKQQGKLYPYEKFAQQYRRPELVQKAFAGK